MSIQAVDSTSPSIQRRHYTQNPDANFFSDFKAAYAHYQSESLSAASANADASQSSTADTPKNSSSSGLADVMGLTFTELAAIRGTGANDQTAYAEILNRAYSQNGMDDPVAFLKSLSPQERSIVQRAHSLANSIDPSTMSKEGAYNLLLPDGYQVDFNHDGIQEVGAARTITFPPVDAPEQLRQAWQTATQNMDEKDRALYQMRMHTMIYGIHIDDQPGRTLAAADQIDSCRLGLDKSLAWLEYTKASLSVERYERDKAFFSDMKRLLA